MTRGRKPKNPADFGKQFEELKKTIPAKKEPEFETEFVMPTKTNNITTEELIAKIKQTLVTVCRFCSNDVENDGYEIIRTFNGGNASVEITYGTSDNYKHFKIKYRESDTKKFAELIEALKEWRRG